MEQPWLAHYPPNVAASIDCNAYASLLPLFTETCQRFTHEIAYENFGTPLSYQELYDNSTHLAAYFQSLGLSPGARIAIMMPNLLQYPIAIFAILRAGFVVTNINPLYTPYELANQLNDSGAEVLIVLDHFAHTVQAALPHISVKQVLITQLGDYFPTWKRWLSQLMMQYFKKMIPAYQIPTAQTWRNALQEGRSKPFTHFEAQHDTLAFLQYTGGTTGISKAAMLTHKNILANLLQATEWISPIGLDHTDIAVTALPMYHIFSLTANCLVFLKIGAKNILITNPRDISHFIKTIRKAGFTTITGVNTLFNTLLHHPDFDKIDFSHLKLTLSGGMALQATVAEQWQKVTHTPIIEAYGLTETSPAVTANPLSITQYNGSIGLPLPSTLVSIRDENEQALPLNQAGELCVQGPQVMEGYWHKPEETSKVFTADHFLKTGDIARMDENGFVYLIDRKKDMILVSGFNVYPNEVEQVISQYPGVTEVGVTRHLDAQGNEQVKACIVSSKVISEAELITYCREHLTAYKVPKIVEFRSELPKTNVGKILRRAL